MPQKQPPASTAVSLEAVLCSSKAGVGSTRASSARANPMKMAPSNGKAKRPIASRAKSDVISETELRFPFILSSSGLLLASRDESKRSRIHTISEARWLRAVVEHMAEMGIAQGTRHGSATHAERIIRRLRDVSFRNRLVEARPARSRFEFRAGIE
jgi:hypothetical protein